jgi:putative transcriptional regulator
MAIRFTLEKMMQDRGLSYRQLADGAGVSTNTLYKMTKKAPLGQMENIGLETLDRLCAFLDIQPGDLIIRVPDEAAAQDAGAGGSDMNTRLLEDAFARYDEERYREFEQLIEMTDLIRQGLSNREIKEKTGAIYATIRAHRKRVKSGWTVEKDGPAAYKKYLKSVGGGRQSLQRAADLLGCNLSDLA